MIGSGASITQSDFGIFVAVFIYSILVMLSLFRKRTRVFGMGLICGPLLVIFAIAVVCGNVKA